jgi:hypothetical protein
MAPEEVDFPERVATQLVEAGAPPTSLAVEHEALEDHYVRLTAGAGS